MSVDISNYVEIDYSTYRDCSGSGCDSICRCGVIEDKSITYVDFMGLIDHFYLKTVPNKRGTRISIIFNQNFEEVDRYCIGRILSKFNVWSNDLESYDILVRNGYYGQEIDGVELLSYDQILDHCLSVSKLKSVNDKIRYVLDLEYGSVDFKSKDFILIDLNRFDIDDKSLNMSYVKSVEDKEISNYKDDIYNLPKGIVRKIGKKYSIIDGYHRIFTSSLEVIPVYQLVK